jgi:hypothetical protein
VERNYRSERDENHAAGYRAQLLSDPEDTASERGARFVMMMMVQIGRLDKIELVLLVIAFLNTRDVFLLGLTCK